MYDRKTFNATTKPQNTMSDKHVKEIHDQGFTVVKQAIDRRTTNELNRLVHNFKLANASHWEHATGSDGLARRIVNLHLALPEFSQALADSQILCQIVKSHFGQTPRIYTSLYFEGGSEQDIHRDTPYFATHPERSFVGLWIALEETSTTNGALQVVRGGHKVGEPDRLRIAQKFFPSLNDIPDMDGRLWDAYQDDVKDLCRQHSLTEEVVSVQAGDVIIWHADLPHGGSHINAPGSSRKSIVFHVTPPRCPVYNMKEFFDENRPRQQFSTWDEAPVSCTNPLDKPTFLVAKTSEHVSFAHILDVKISELNLQGIRDSQCPQGQ